jgi:SAM-dependent methyltransferase
MNTETCTALLELNRRFYAQFAGDFARTRRSWPPGFDCILPHLWPSANVADLGCGNGRLLNFLAERGWRGRYLGVDSSAGLLAIADADAQRLTPPGAAIQAQFHRDDLVSLAPGASRAPWVDALGRGEWGAVTALAVLHHIPGRAHRAELLAACAELLRPGGALVVSTWQFLTTARLNTRILPWELAGVRSEDVEPDDYLLPWGEAAAGKRYCAAINAEALAELADSARTGLAHEATLYADGHEGNLNLYGIFRKRRVDKETSRQGDE